MLVQIQPIQIPTFWEPIKYATIHSDEIEKEYQEEYFIQLLQDLLSSKIICFVGQSDSAIDFIVLLEFKVEKLKNFKYLYFRNIYSFKPQENKIWQEVFGDLYKIAKNNDCKAIIGDSNNPKIEEINYSVGAKCISKKYAYYL